MMFGFMFIEIESLDELKLLTSGNGKVACNVGVVETLEDFTAIECEKKNVKRRKILGDGIAMKLLLLHEQ